MTLNPDPVGNLPAEPNAFIGRERDLSELAAMLDRVRALTLCGPGGIGKTRLALRLAGVLAPCFRDGAWIADLAEADSPERIVQLVSAALQIRQEPDRALLETLAEALRPRTMLLVLDTCETLVQATAEFVQELLASCPSLRIIATSREALRVRGEVIWRVPPLGIPAAPDGQDGIPAGRPGEIAESEAARLFLARASAVRPGFALDQGNAAAVAEICRTLDGVPLAIELAAARVRSLSPEQIRTRLASKFQLLAHGDRTAPPRQQTLRATVEWSYDLLNERERKLLSRLSVFHSWSLDMAEQVCADARLAASGVLDLLTALIDKSLVIVEADAEGEPRYRLLDTVRDLAAELAAADAELPALRAAHRDCLLAMAEGVASVAFLRGEPPWPERVAMYHRILAERANFRLALAYCVQHNETEQGLRLCVALTGYWLGSGDVADGADWVDQMLVLAGSAHPGLRARALALRAELAFEQEDYQGAARFATECLELSLSCGEGNPASALRMRAFTMLMSGRAGEALTVADEAVQAARQMADAWEEGMALSARAAVLAGQGEDELAKAAFTEALELLTDNNRWGVANVLYGLGKLARARGDAESALRYFGDALAIYSEIDARPEMGRCLGAIGIVALSRPDLALARASLRRSVRLSLATGQRLGVARGLAALAALALADGDFVQAARIAGAARALFAVIGGGQAVSALRRLDRVVDLAADRLGQEETAALTAQGRVLSPYQVLALSAPERDGSAAALWHVNGSPYQGLADLEPHQAAQLSSGTSAGHELAWPGTLTEREREVAMLVARGLSNRDIGTELFITSATAARHVSNIFGKLGFSSRSQVIAWVVRSGQA